MSLEDAFHGATRLVELNGKRLEVKIPAGVETGSRIRLSGRGGGEGAGARDLVLIAKVAPHPVFGRDGATLTRELPVTLREALLGAEVPVRTLTGRVLLRVPAGTQNGRVIRLGGQGMPRLKGDGRGDLHVKIRVILPVLDERGAGGRRRAPRQGRPARPEVRRMNARPAARTRPTLPAATSPDASAARPTLPAATRPDRKDPTAP